ncbi:MAG: hypothetical protein EAZ57_10840 [Cytophagales bacterium]|nr:MAG: hypothetical protein EAZ67_12745 [Cytophagales bacterium]TAF59469.1 MAG: hypothetical protein EAZ57_10840 [Cytophagales bacterium]
MKSLLQEFVLPSYQDWLKLVQKDLKGERFKDKLLWHLEPNLAIEAMPPVQEIMSAALSFEPEPGQLTAFDWCAMPFFRGAGLQNKELLNALNAGASGLLIEPEPDTNWEVLLKDVELSYCKLGVVANAQNAASVSRLEIFLKPLNPLCVFLIGAKKINNADLQLVKVAASKEPSQDIADAIRQAATLLPQAQASAQDFKSIGFSLTLSNYFFADIAKIKAIRLLFAMLAESQGVEQFSEKDVFLHAQTTLLQADANSNLISNTVQALAATLAGVQALTVFPHEDNAFGQRIALNVSNLLREETHIGKVADPLAGAYYLESFVEKLTQKAFELLQKS